MDLESTTSWKNTSVKKRPLIHKKQIIVPDGYGIKYGFNVCLGSDKADITFIAHCNFNGHAMLIAGY